MSKEFVNPTLEITAPADLPAGFLRAATPQARQAKNRAFRLGSTWRSYIGVVLIPVMLFAGYNALATDRYAAAASFVLRSAASEGGGDLMDSLTGSVSAGSTKSDSYIVRRFLESADLVREVDRKFDLIRLYGAERADVFQRLYGWSSFEDRVDYWNRRVSSNYDNTSGILSLEVQAYSAEEARDIADFVMTKIDGLVNTLSHAARETSYAYAREEMERAEDRLRAAQAAMQQFRTMNNIADPSLSAGRDDMLAFELNKQIIEAETRLAVLKKNVQVSAPNITALSDRVEALKAQRDALRGDIGKGDGAASVTAAIMNDYESRQLDVEIARTRYMSTIEGLESTRQTAERQQRYLAVFSAPYAADTAEYPRRIINTLIALVSLSLLWGISHLMAQMIRDHRQ